MPSLYRITLAFPLLLYVYAQTQSQTRNLYRHTIMTASTVDDVLRVLRERLVVSASAHQSSTSTRGKAAVVNEPSPSSSADLASPPPNDPRSTGAANRQSTPATVAGGASTELRPRGASVASPSPRVTSVPGRRSAPSPSSGYRYWQVEDTLRRVGTGGTALLPATFRGQQPPRSSGFATNTTKRPKRRSESNCSAAYERVVVEEERRLLERQLEKEAALRRSLPGAIFHSHKKERSTASSRREELSTARTLQEDNVATRTTSYTFSSSSVRTDNLQTATASATELAIKRQDLAPSLPSSTMRSASGGRPISPRSAVTNLGTTRMASYSTGSSGTMMVSGSQPHSAHSVVGQQQHLDTSTVFIPSQRVQLGVSLRAPQQKQYPPDASLHTPPLQSLPSSYTNHNSAGRSVGSPGAPSGAADVEDDDVEDVPSGMVSQSTISLSSMDECRLSGRRGRRESSSTANSVAESMDTSVLGQRLPHRTDEAAGQQQQGGWYSVINSSVCTTSSTVDHLTPQREPRLHVDAAPRCEVVLGSHATAFEQRWLGVPEDHCGRAVPVPSSLEEESSSQRIAVVAATSFSSIKPPPRPAGRDGSSADAISGSGRALDADGDGVDLNTPTNHRHYHDDHGECRHELGPSHRSPPRHHRHRKLDTTGAHVLQHTSEAQMQRLLPTRHFFNSPTVPHGTKRGKNAAPPAHSTPTNRSLSGSQRMPTPPRIATPKKGLNNNYICGVPRPRTPPRRAASAAALRRWEVGWDPHTAKPTSTRTRRMTSPSSSPAVTTPSSRLQSRRPSSPAYPTNAPTRAGSVVTSRSRRTSAQLLPVTMSAVHTQRGPHSGPPVRTPSRSSVQSSSTVAPQLFLLEATIVLLMHCAGGSESHATPTVVDVGGGSSPLSVQSPQTVKRARHDTASSDKKRHARLLRSCLQSLDALTPGVLASLRRGLLHGCITGLQRHAAVVGTQHHHLSSNGASLASDPIVHWLRTGLVTSESLQSALVSSCSPLLADLWPKGTPPEQQPSPFSTHCSSPPSWTTAWELTACLRWMDKYSLHAVRRTATSLFGNCAAGASLTQVPRAPQPTGASSSSADFGISFLVEDKSENAGSNTGHLRAGLTANGSVEASLMKLLLSSIGKPLFNAAVWAVHKGIRDTLAIVRDRWDGATDETAASCAPSRHLTFNDEEAPEETPAETQPIWLRILGGSVARWWSAREAVGGDRKGGTPLPDSYMEMVAVLYFGLSVSGLGRGGHQPHVDPSSDIPEASPMSKLVSQATSSTSRADGEAMLALSIEDTVFYHQFGSVWERIVSNVETPSVESSAKDVHDALLLRFLSLCEVIKMYVDPHSPANPLPDLSPLPLGSSVSLNSTPPTRPAAKVALFINGELHASAAAPSWGGLLDFNNSKSKGDAPAAVSSAPSTEAARRHALLTVAIPFAAVHLMLTDIDATADIRLAGGGDDGASA